MSWHRIAVALACSWLLTSPLQTTPALAADGASTVSTRPGDTGASFDPDTVLVRFKAGTTETTQEKVSDSFDLVKADELTLGKGDVHVFDVAEGDNSASLANKLRKNPNVEFAEPDYRLQATAITSDALVDSYWGLSNSGQNIRGQVGISGKDANVASAWNTTTGSNVLVAVIDEGIDINHPELTGHIYRNNADCFNDGVDHDRNGFVNDCNGWDFYHGDKSVFDAADGDDHGTHVAGTIAATANNSVGGAGVAPSAVILPLKFLGPDGGSTSDAIRALAYAKAAGAKVVNCSWGGSTYSELLRSAIANSGMTVVVSAGNSGVDLTASPQYPASFTLSNQITVAAVDNRGALASFSNRGGATDLAAPGVDILSTAPRATAVSIGLSQTPVNGVYKSDFWGFGLEAVPNAGKRRDLIVAAMQRLGATALNSPITVVDDDESSSGSTATPDTSSYYTAALALAGYTNVSVVNVAKNASGPTAASLAGRTVIWQTGYASGSTSVYTLTSTDVSQLTSFLNGGGRLLVAGADAIWRNESDTFVEDVLGVEFLAEGAGRAAAVGTSTTYAGISFSISGSESPKGVQNPYNDMVAPWTVTAVSSLELLGDSNYNSAYAYKSGTSMAAPHVAGVAALVAAAKPSLSAANIVSIIRSTTRAESSLAGVTRSGGVVDASAAVNAAAGFSATLPIAGGMPGTGSTGSSVGAGALRSATGYRFVASDGGIFAFGDASFQGSAGGSKLNQPIVGMAATPDRNGYWLVARDGGIFAFGNAAFLGSTGAIRLNSPIVGMAATPSGNGYWLVASDGGIFAFGDAGFYGSTGAIRLNQPIVGITSTPSGAGYWMVARDGGIFAFGDAAFQGSTGAIKLNQPIVGITATPSGGGYWMVASDGGIFAFGDAAFRGSAGATKLNQPIVGIGATPSGNGYWLVASDGGVFAFGDAAFYGSTGAIKLNQPIIAMVN